MDKLDREVEREMGEMLSRMDNRENVTDDIDMYIYEVFESEEHDIDALSSIVDFFNKKILSITSSNNDNTQNTQHTQKMVSYLNKKRLFAKKMLMSKSRSGYDYINDKSNKSNKNNKNKMCQEDESPYWFRNVEKCKEQYNHFIETIWNPSVDEIKKFL